MEHYQTSKEALLSEFHASQNGLSDSEASAASDAYGKNTLVETKQEPVPIIFLKQFADLLVIILIIAACISMVTGDAESTVVILAVLLLNAVLGTVQRVKAQKSLDVLKQLSAPKAKVRRNGMKTEIDAAELVPGDLLLLEAGDLISADGRIFENFSLQVNESSLTGESANVDKSDTTLTKDVALADRVNMVYSGSLVTYGRATVLVTATGMCLLVLLVLFVPGVQRLFSVVPMTAAQFGQLLGLAALPTVLIQFGRAGKERCQTVTAN